ncbi:MAG: terminase small subunit [Alphaproteobacteria bacterium]|nr:terminase small subunit [Alphaproteobacteria bacterium]MCW5739167.1 terminase small subunit [Alphaproteobacteria bacterium]
MSSTRPLNSRQKRFVDGYLATLNAEKAYRRAGYATRGATGLPKRMFHLPAVRTAIEEGLARQAREIEIDSHRVIAQYKAVAFASIGDFVSIAPGGALSVSQSTINPASLPALASFDVREYRTPKARGGERVRRVRIGIACKLRALGELARHLGLFTARHGAAVTPSPDRAADPAPDGARPLDARRARFVDEFLRCGNATQAYVRAGHKAAHAHHHAWRLMARPEVRAAIETGRRRLVRQCEVHPQRVIAEFAAIGFGNVAHFMEFDDDGTARVDLSLALPEQIAALREIVIEEYCDRPPEDPRRVRRAHLKLASRQQALDALAQHLRLFDGSDAR